MRLLDLFCGAGGCSVGYRRAGFDVVGVDIEPHDDYPFGLHVMDWAESRPMWDDFDVIHASPPCPRYSSITTNRDAHPDLVQPVRVALVEWGGVYVIENVPGAPLLSPAQLCGASFGLGINGRQLRRHRLFESNVALLALPCACDQKQKVGVYGTGGGGYYPSRNRGGGYKAHPHERGPALGIDWMRRGCDLADAIPPAYTEHIGRQLIDHLRAMAS